jgi:FtsP/CotA-like multicopper oxidase with cupredoxin domain
MLLTILTVAGVLASSVVLVGGLHASQNAASSSTAVILPPGCVRPAGGFLIIQSEYGYNDSILEGAGPTKAWPVITVTQGETVNITVCNVDKSQSHGFQISSYFDSTIEAVGPGQVLHVPAFVASKTGTFQIYCAIWCTIHVFMEYGQLRVVS